MVETAAEFRRGKSTAATKTGTASRSTIDPITSTRQRLSGGSSNTWCHDRSSTESSKLRSLSATGDAGEKRREQIVLPLQQGDAVQLQQSLGLPQCGFPVPRRGSRNRRRCVGLIGSSGAPFPWQWNNLSKQGGQRYRSRPGSSGAIVVELPGDPWGRPASMVIGWLVSGWITEMERAWRPSRPSSGRSTVDLRGR